MQELSGNNFTKSTRPRTIMHSLLCSGAQDRDLRPPTRYVWRAIWHAVPPPRVAAANFSFILSWLFFKESLGRVTQCDERILDKLAKAINAMGPLQD